LKTPTTQVKSNPLSFGEGWGEVLCILL